MSRPRLITTLFSVLTTSVISNTLVASQLIDQQPLGPTLAGQNVSNGNPFDSDFADFANDALKRWKVPGLAIAVVDGDDIYAEGYGIATFPDIPATPETIWYGASTSKAQLGATLAQLIASGAHPELADGWSTPISSIIRDDFVLQDEWATTHLTLDDAVSHRTGMARHDASSAHILPDGRVATPRDIVRNLRNLPYTTPPRVVFKYCNLMFVTLSHVVETITGRWLGDVIRETIWEPLGMNSTYFDLAQALDAPGHFASGYQWLEKEGKYVEFPKMELSEISGAGSVLSTALDYAKWVRCLIHEAEPLSKEAHRDIKTPRMIGSLHPSNGLDIQLYTLGWDRTLFRGHVVIMHNGGMHAYGSYVYWLPEIKYGVVAFANTAITSNAVEEVLAWRLIQDKLGIAEDERFDFEARWRRMVEENNQSLGDAIDRLYPDRPAVPLPPTVNITQLTGTYSDEGYGSFTLRVVPSEDDESESVLITDRPDMTWRYQLVMHHVSADFWVVKETFAENPDSLMSGFLKAEFIYGVDGRVSGLKTEWIGTVDSQTDGTVMFDRIH